MRMWGIVVYLVQSSDRMSDWLLLPGIFSETPGYQEWRITMFSIIMVEVMKCDIEDAVQYLVKDDTGSVSGGGDKMWHWRCGPISTPPRQALPNLRVRHGLPACHQFIALLFAGQRPRADKGTEARHRGRSAPRLQEMVHYPGRQRKICQPGSPDCSGCHCRGRGAKATTAIIRVISSLCIIPRAVDQVFASALHAAQRERMGGEESCANTHTHMLKSKQCTEL